METILLDVGETPKVRFLSIGGDLRLSGSGNTPGPPDFGIGFAQIWVKGERSRGGRRVRITRNRCLRGKQLRS